MSGQCPLCEGDAYRVIYAGFPMWLCRAADCSCVWGFWSWVSTLPIPQDEFAFFAYTGSYWRALLRWLMGGFEAGP